MALVSPGVEVKVVDESFYTPAEPGTLPCIFVATAGNKPNGSGSGTAAGTLASNAGVPYLLTSQRDLVDTFGDPIFKTDNNNNPIHGSELNEYGLQAAYSFLGIANRAYVVRADIDLAELEGSPTAPGAAPMDGAYWFDTSTTLWGLQEWNGESLINDGQVFTNKEPIVITDETETSNTGSLSVNGFAGYIPAKTVGSIGQYAVVATSTLNRAFYRNRSGDWVLVGSDQWVKSWPTAKGTNVFEFAGAQAAALEITLYQEDGTAHNESGQAVSIALNPGDTAADVALTINTVYVAGNVSAQAVDGRLEIYTTGRFSDGGWVSHMTITNSPSADIDGFAEIGITADTGTPTIATRYIPKLQISKHTSIPEFKALDAKPRPTGSVWLKTTIPNLGAKLDVKKWNDSTKLWEGQDVNIYPSNAEAIYEMDRSGGGVNLLTGQLYALSDVGKGFRPTATIKLYRRDNIAPTTVTGTKISVGSLTAGTKTFTISSTDNGSLTMSSPVTVSFDPTGQASDATLLASAISDAGVDNVSATVTSQNKVQIIHSLGGEIKFVDTNGSLAEAGFTPFVDENNGTPNLYYALGTDNTTIPSELQASLWKVLTYTASNNEVLGATEDRTLWYNSIVDEVDILVHNGSEFVGYLYDGSSGQSATASPYYDADETAQTDPNGPIVSASIPLTQSDGTALVTGDLWIDTSDIDNFPVIYKFNAGRTDIPLVRRWFTVDTTDQTSENGVLFADARYNTAGANSDTPGEIADLLHSDYMDPDGPDPALYPKGMLLFNLRRSGFNVKRFRKNYVNTATKNIRYNDEPMDGYVPDRWVTESGNQEDGSGSFGRIAQRKVVVQALQALVNSNEEIRDDESRLFNLMACPGYPELIGELNTLNYDRGLTAFIVGDSPFRLEATGTNLNNWATNVNNATEDNDTGLVSSDPYMAVYYPSGFTSDNFGNNVVVPASHMMLRTIALSDQVAYPWFAPAGTRRGNITNATASGYITSEGEFKSLAMNEGLRDTLYSNNVNPITFITGAGLVCFGQKTRQLTASALDRINVARLIIYLRSQLKVLAKPYLFEPNDKITRDEIKQQVETLLLELVGLRALYDFLVVCDESNNTPARIDRNELYVDIAIEPVKAIEFIYIPLRIKNTGEISGL